MSGRRTAALVIGALLVLAGAALVGVSAARADAGGRLLPSIGRAVVGFGAFGELAIDVALVPPEREPPGAPATELREAEREAERVERFSGRSWSAVLLRLVRFVFSDDSWRAPLRDLEGLSAEAQAPVPVPVPVPALGSGLLLWVLGWALVALGLSSRPQEGLATNGGIQAPLHPKLARYRDFYWSTLLSYGLGIFLSVCVMVLVQTVAVRAGLSHLTALLLSAPLACLTAFGGGFLGAWRAGRFSVPEATIAVLYLGLPWLFVLPALARSPMFAAPLREITYLASLLGRPELSYGVAFCGLVLMLFFGITAGFVATSSGRIDLRAGFELFVAARHVAVLRPRLVGGVFAVLAFLVVPPLLLWSIIKGAASAVERLRIKQIGLSDPIAAAEAQTQAASRTQRPTEMMTALSVGGVGVGVMALIIIMSVMSGFEDDLQKKILGTNAHAVVLKYAEPMAEYRDVMEKVKGVRGVVGQTPFILNEVMLASESGAAGVMIKGIDPSTVGSVTDLPSYLLPGGSLAALDRPELITPRRLAGEGGPALDDTPAREVNPLADDPMIEHPPEEASAKGQATLPGIVVGRELAWQLKVVVGDRVKVISPFSEDLGPQGPMPRTRPFRIAGIFYSGMYEYDSKFVYVRLGEAQSFFGLGGVTGIELKVADIDDARRISRAVHDRLEGYPYRTKDWGEMNRNLFSALRLEKLVMAIILTIIVIIAAGLIVATVMMLVLEKRKEIAVLKALGVSDGGVVKVFLIEGLQIGVVGSVLGLIAGLLHCVLIERFGIKLDPEVYYIPSLPVKIEPLQTALSVVVAILVTFLASVYPALKASQVEPVDGLKAE